MRGISARGFFEIANIYRIFSETGRFCLFFRIGRYGFKKSPGAVCLPRGF
jgi:hypothetical protein